MFKEHDLEAGDSPPFGIRFSLQMSPCHGQSSFASQTHFGGRDAGGEQCIPRARAGSSCSCRPLFWAQVLPFSHHVWPCHIPAPTLVSSFPSLCLSSLVEMAGVAGRACAARVSVPAGLSPQSGVGKAHRLYCYLGSRAPLVYREPQKLLFPWAPGSALLPDQTTGGRVWLSLLLRVPPGGCGAAGLEVAEPGPRRSPALTLQPGFWKGGPGCPLWLGLRTGSPRGPHCSGAG